MSSNGLPFFLRFHCVQVFLYAAVLLGLSILVPFNLTPLYILYACLYVHIFIFSVGCVPNFLLEKIPGMLGMDVASDTPGAEQLEEGDADSDGERKRRRRRSVGGKRFVLHGLVSDPGPFLQQ